MSNLMFALLCWSVPYGFLGGMIVFALLGD